LTREYQKVLEESIADQAKGGLGNFARHNANPRPNWPEVYCVEGNNQVLIGKENYFLSGDGFLMPAKKGQPPPDLRYFKQSSK
jgi:hypothetical protein